MERIKRKVFEKNCPPSTVCFGRGVQWWNKHLETLRSRTRKLYNRAQKTKEAVDWGLYKVAQKEYKNKINKYKQEGWRDFNEESKNVPKTALLHKILAKNSRGQVLL